MSCAKCACKMKASVHRWFSGRMLACHAGGPGSIPGRCKFWQGLEGQKHIHMTGKTVLLSHRAEGTICASFEWGWEGPRSKTRVRQPGVEPGSTAWKATMLTVTPLTLDRNGSLFRQNRTVEILQRNLLLQTYQILMSLRVMYSCIPSMPHLQVNVVQPYHSIHSIINIPIPRSYINVQ